MNKSEMVGERAGPVMRHRLCMLDCPYTVTVT